MSGIVLHVDSRAGLDFGNFSNTLSDFCLGDLIVKSIYQKGEINAALLSTQDSEGSSAYDTDLGLYVMVDGYFVENLGASKSSAEWFIQNYKVQGDSLLNQLNGSYNIALINERTRDIRIINDRYGTRPLFYSATNDFMVVSPFASVINKLDIVEKQLNLRMVANQLSYSRVWLDNATFFKGISSLPASSCLEWLNGSGSKESELYISGQSETSCRGEVTELAETFRAVMSDFSKVKDVGLSLSGGLDSRILLASGFKGPTFTWGYQENNDEISLAQKTAETAGNTWSFVKLTPEDFLDKYGDGDHFREGLDIFVQSYALKGYPLAKASGIRGLMTGVALDVTMAGSYGFAGDNSRLTADSAFRFLCSKAEYFNEAERKRLIINNDTVEEINGLTSFVQSQVDAKKSGDFSELIKKFFFEYRVRRCLFQRQQWQRAFLEDYIPTFDNRLIGCLASFSSEELQDHNVFTKVLEMLNPKLMSIPYQGTMLPVSTPRKYWKEGIRIENEREQLYRRIFAETNGEIFIPYNRYYSNFDEWLRSNEDWIGHCKKLLLSEDTILSQFCDLDVINEWITLQESGKGTYFSKIIQLMSLEKTLRSHFG